MSDFTWFLAKKHPAAAMLMEKLPGWTLRCSVRPHIAIDFDHVQFLPWVVTSEHNPMTEATTLDRHNPQGEESHTGHAVSVLSVDHSDVS